MFIIEYKKNLTMSYTKIKSKFFVYLHQSMVTNEHQYVTKMISNARMGGLWGDFGIFWITKYLQRPIYNLESNIKTHYILILHEFSIYPLTYSVQFSTF